jgi:hypothetical protein
VGNSRDERRCVRLFDRSKAEQSCLIDGSEFVFVFMSCDRVRVFYRGLRVDRLRAEAAQVPHDAVAKRSLRPGYGTGIGDGNAVVGFCEGSALDSIEFEDLSHVREIGGFDAVS